MTSRTGASRKRSGRLAPWLVGLAPTLVFGAFGTWLFVRPTRRGLVA